MYTEKKRTRFLALPFYFTSYMVEEERVTIKKGLFTTTEDACYMYKVNDVRLVRSLMERIFGLGTLILFTGDTTHAELRLEHIRHSEEIKEYLLEKSEEARIRRHTVNTLDINRGEPSEFLEE